MPHGGSAFSAAQSPAVVHGWATRSMICASGAWCRSCWRGFVLDGTVLARMAQWLLLGSEWWRGFSATSGGVAPRQRATLPLFFILLILELVIFFSYHINVLKPPFFTPFSCISLYAGLMPDLLESGTFRLILNTLFDNKHSL